MIEPYSFYGLFMHRPPEHFKPLS